MYGNTIKRVILGTDIQRSIPIRKANPLISLDGTGVNEKDAVLDFTREMLTRGTMVLGETGSGKTFFCRKMVKALRKNLPKNYSMVIVQAKNDFNECMLEGDYIIEQG